MRLFALLCLLPVLLAPARAASVEEARLDTVASALPALSQSAQALSAGFTDAWGAVPDQARALQLARQRGQQLWQAGKQRLRAAGDFDDRPLYWARLQLSRVVRDTAPGFAISTAERAAVLEQLEQGSRGINDIGFADTRQVRRILITGFDPFLLDRRLGQSNPSGLIAQLLDGREFEHHGQRIRIEAAIVPVRYADFDAGLIESLLRPWLGQIDLLATISMGRSDFDLERFPGRRRSANVVDNLNVLPGASRQDPRPPLLDGQPLAGPEFVEFSLPVARMQAAPGPFRVNDNRQVRVLPDALLQADSLAALAGKVAVEGGGGGYLSNEIAYRAARLRDGLGLGRLPVGHIHTPAITEFDAAQLARISAQVEAMLLAALD